MRKKKLCYRVFNSEFITNKLFWAPLQKIMKYISSSLQKNEGMTTPSDALHKHRISLGLVGERDFAKYKNKLSIGQEQIINWAEYPDLRYLRYFTCHTALRTRSIHVRLKHFTITVSLYHNFTLTSFGTI